MSDFMDWLRGITPGSISSPQGTPGVVTDPSAPYSAAQPVAPDPIPPNLGPRVSAPAPAGPDTPFVPPQAAAPDNGLPIGPGGLPNIGAMLENIKNAPPTPAQSVPVDAPPAAAAPAAPPLSPPAPIGAGAGLAPDVAANAPPAPAGPTPLAPAPDAGPAAPSDTPAGKSLLERIIGSSDASTKDASGLTDADRHATGFSALAKLGFGIMAASMPQNPNQRAATLAQLGSIPAGVLKERAAMIGEQAQAQRVQLGKQQLDAKKASLDYMKSPEFQETLKNLPPQMQGVMKAAAAAGDLGAIAHIQQGMLPKMVGNTIFNPATGQYSNTLTGASGGPGGTPGAPAPGGAPVAPSDGLPAPAPPTPGYAPLADTKPVTPGLKPEVLSAYSPEIATAAKAVGEGTKAIPSLTDRNGIGLQIYKAAKAYNPSLDEATYGTRLDQKKHLNNEFFGSGRTAKNITALDTAYGHIGMLSDLTKDLNGNSPQLVNQALAKLNTAFGGTKYTQADVASGAVAHEMAKVFRDTGMSNEDAQEWAKRLDVGKSSGPQMAASLNTALGLMEERKRALETQYKRGGGEGSTDWFTPEHTAKSQQIKGDFTRQQFGLAPGANVTDFEYSRDANGQIVRKPKKH